MNGFIRDNRSKGTVGKFLEDNIKPESNLSIVSAYFTIYAYEKLSKQLDSIKSLKFLFGEPTFVSSIAKLTDKKDYKIEDDANLSLRSRLEQGATARKCAQWIQEKVEIRSMVKPNFLHGKLYHIGRGEGDEIQKAIAGSSNFTVNGLGLGTNPNMELNIIIDSDSGRKEIKSWFEELWKDEGLTEDVKSDVIKYLEQLYAENDPEFIYLKTLYHVFDKFIQEQNDNELINPKTGFFETEIWAMLYNFQKDGVKVGINKILKHKGCIIADSVGLGKTFEALAIIRYFELLNERVLVLCPKKLSENWTIYQASQGNALNPFQKDKFNYTVLAHTDLGRKKGFSSANGINLDTFNWQNYDLVVIDESHNFRGNPMDKTKEDGEKTMNRAKFLMEKIIKEGKDTKVLLLSATPVNNNLKDLRNQIAFITKGKADALFEKTQIKDIPTLLKNAQTVFTNWADHKKNPDRRTKELMDKIDSGFFKLLDELTIARSRKHIKEFYHEDEMGKFPTREKPISIYAKIDLRNRAQTYSRINAQIMAYNLVIFKPSNYVQDEFKEQYEEKAASAGVANFKQNDREDYLIGMMKVNYLKRLESSVNSFAISLDRTIVKIEKLIEKIDAFQKTKKISQEENIDIEDIENDEENEADAQDWEIGKKLKFNLAHLDLERWRKDLEQDKASLIDIHEPASAITVERDAKLHELKTCIENKIKLGKNNGNKKVLVFTAFSDTAKYLYDALKAWVEKDLGLKIALVTGSETKTDFGINNFSYILTNFAPIAKKREQLKVKETAEIDILIATDCISEGQNLQDCDFLINYDIHWNPVRIIQRFGRIDRLGSKNDSIQLVNFWPTQDLDEYINLKHRVEARMTLVDLAATNEENMLNEKETEELIDEDLKYRTKQLKNMQNEVLDLEEMDESVSFSDFSLDDFRLELLKFLENNKQKLADASLGLYAVVPSPSGKHKELFTKEISSLQADIIRPGIIFCLRQKETQDEAQALNPMLPYFLVYIRQDGTVRYNYTNAKQILEIFRLLCSGENKPSEKLCDIFNEETKHGKDMIESSILLKNAIAKILEVFNKKSYQKATTDRNAILLPKSKKTDDANNFDLITWLIIK